ncbi:MAG TPA: PIG-L family deacetylase [Nocardioides sp.]|nr:PIG-L family deacetylase [Nocardioides sp.]
MNADSGALLGVWAHPDDEAYLSAGLMAQARGAGRRVVVVTATRGEHGTDDPRSWPADRLAHLREAELAESLRVVGVDEHVWLGYADGGLARAERRLAVSSLQRVIENVAPGTIVTFGPDGMTGHDDHRTISSWVTEAWRRSGRRAALWYATLTPEFHAAWGPLNDRVGLWCEGTQPPVTPRRHLVAEVVCTGTLGDLKHRALRAHASQTRPLEELVGAETYRRWWSTESFVAAEAPVSRSSATVDAGRRGSTYADRHALRPPASA